MTDLSQALKRCGPYLLLLAILLALFAASLQATGGRFVYTLDDPYIHLAFSEQLLRGHFGLVPGIAASPSSSVLYPLLLMPLAGTELHAWQPLFWCVLSLLASLWLWLRLLRRYILPDPAFGESWIVTFLAILALAAVNAIGLAFSGMESCLQVMLALAACVGLAEFLHDGKVRWWLVGGIVLGPLIRYENLTVSLAALAVVALFGRWRLAVAAGACIAAALGAYAAYCSSIGLPPIPGSALSKLAVDTSDFHPLRFALDALHRLYAQLQYGRPETAMLPLMLLLALNIIFAPDTGKSTRDRAMALFGLAVLATQFVFGLHGSLGRYDAYAWSVGLASAAVTNRTLFHAALRRWSGGRCALAAGVIVLALFPYPMVSLVKTPLAAQDIYRQQWQMRRLAVKYIRAPVMANDVGLLSYRNPYGVIDLMGLGSERIRLLRQQSGLDAAAMDRLATESGARVAMVYDAWFGALLPPSWQRVGRLQLGRGKVSVAAPEVGIYAIRPDEAAALRRELHAFAPTLPPGARLVFD